MWDALMYSQVLFIRYYIGTTSLHESSNYLNIVFDVCYCLLYLSFPLFGLLADVWIGRYKAVTAGIIMCFLAWIFAGIGYIVTHLFEFSSSIIYFILYGLGYLLELVGYTSFKANIIQYNIDQLVGASADDTGIASVYHWHFLFYNYVVV